MKLRGDKGTRGLIPIAQKTIIHKFRITKMFDILL